jgi:hypothetical protein
VVEHYLAKVGVASSSLVSRSSLLEASSNDLAERTSEASATWLSLIVIAVTFPVDTRCKSIRNGSLQHWRRYALSAPLEAVWRTSICPSRTR